MVGNEDGLGESFLVQGDEEALIYSSLFWSGGRSGWGASSIGGGGQGQLVELVLWVYL